MGVRRADCCDFAREGANRPVNAFLDLDFPPSCPKSL
jgi:hypothetical protein